jgi:hypothetical protein
MVKAGNLQPAGVLMFVTAALHLIAFIPAGLHTDGLQMIPVGIVYALIGWGLLRGWRWLGYLTFLMLLVFAIVAYGMVGNTAIPDWFMWTIIVVDLGVILTLFLALWRPSPAAKLN